MKKFFLLLVAAISLSACINEDGIEIKLPSSIAIQWLSDDAEGTGEVTLWDFTSNPGCVSFVVFHSLEDLKTIPQYNSLKQYIFDVVCRKKGDIYTISVADEYGSKYYFTDVTSKSAIATRADNGFQWQLYPCPVKVSANPVDY